jgi:hypothetical protein
MTLGEGKSIWTTEVLHDFAVIGRIFSFKE